MVTETVEINLQLILVEQLVDTAGRGGSLHRPEVLTPASATRILLQSLFLRSSVGSGEVQPLQDFTSLVLGIIA